MLRSTYERPVLYQALGKLTPRETFAAPATQKILSDRDNRKGKKGVFPLWTQKAGFGVISIFKKGETTPYISNDRINAGVVAFFGNEPNLRTLEYRSGGKEELAKLE